MGVKIRLDARALAKLDGSVLKAAEMTMEALRDRRGVGSGHAIQRRNHAE